MDMDCGEFGRPSAVFFCHRLKPTSATWSPGAGQVSWRLWDVVYSYGPSLHGCVQLGVGLFMGMDTMRSSEEDGFLEGFICYFLTHL